MTVLLNVQVLVAGGGTFEKGLEHLVQIASAELYTPLWQEVNYFRFQNRGMRSSIARNLESLLAPAINSE